jgi:hypothetical protein
MKNMKDEQLAKQRRGAVITAIILGGVALLFYVLFIALRW